MKFPILFVCLTATVCVIPAIDLKSDEPAKSNVPPVDSIQGKAAGQVRDDNALKLRLIWCPPGKFMMGSPASEIGAAGIHSENEDQVSVTLTNGFCLGKYEVTQQEYEQIMEINPSAFTATGKYSEIVSDIETHRFPVEYVSYDDASEFCRKLTDEERRAGRLPATWEYRLPTEAQWEYACRAGTTTPFSCGNKLTVKDANCGGQDASDFDNTLHRTAAAGSFAENPWGLCDMHGNVFEWCRDFYLAKLPGGTEPEVTKAGVFRTERGGAWNFYSAACRSAARRPRRPETRSDNTGFRVALVPIR